MRRLPLVLFDVLFLFFAVLVYGAAAAAALAAADWIWGPPLWQRALAIVAGYFVFLHAFVVVVGVVRRIVQPKLTVGFSKVGLNKHYFAWGLNSVFQGLFTTSFFDRQIHIIFYLKYLYYRAMGMKLPFNAVIGTRAVIRQAELIELGDKVVLGEMSGLYGHVSPDGKRHFMGTIKIGDGSLIGGYAVIGPDVEIGRESVLCSHVLVSSMARIGDRVEIGVGTFIQARARVPDDVRVLPGSVVTHGAGMEPGETWGGNPAVRIEGKKRRGPALAAEGTKEAEA
jgi:acetyltransferase-like isoleucine patch superfamily enzyme